MDYLQLYLRLLNKIFFFLQLDYILNNKIEKETIYNILVPSSLVSEFNDVLSLKGYDKAINLFKNIFDNFFIKNNAKMVE